MFHAFSVFAAVDMAGSVVQARRSPLVSIGAPLLWEVIGYRLLPHRLQLAGHWEQTDQPEQPPMQNWIKTWLCATFASRLPANRLGRMQQGSI
jgi:hypothetical protein